MIGIRSTKDAIDIVRAAARDANKRTMKELIQHARDYKPGGYDEHQGVMRDFYLGHQVPHLKARLKEHYRHTFGQMEPITVNVVRASSELNAQAYRQLPQRWLTVDGEKPGEVSLNDDTGEETTAAPGEVERAERFQRLLELARLHLVIPEIERRLMATKTIFARLAYNDSGADQGRRPRYEITPFWPHQVHVIPNPEHPCELWAAHALIAEISAPTGVKRTRWYEVWTRREPLGAWQVQHVNDEGLTRGPPREYELPQLPWVVFHDGLSTESIYQDVGRDLRDMQETINERLTDWAFGSKMQSHGERVFSGPGVDKLKGTTLVGGPGIAITLPEGTDSKVLSYPYSLITLEGIEKMLRMYGVSERQSPDAWATEPGPPLSGVSRIVQNIPSDQKRAERIDLYRVVEETDLLPQLARIADAFGDLGGPIDGEGVEYHARFTLPPVYEDPMAKQDRAFKALDKGVITEARAAVLADHYRTVEDAVKAGLSDTLASAPVPEALANAGPPPPMAEDDQAPADEDEGAEAEPMGDPAE